MAMPAMANHLWQATVFAAAAWVLALALRKNRAAVRYWIWLAASVKFLVPFSLLVNAGSRVEWRPVPAVARPEVRAVMTELNEPFPVAAEGAPRAAVAPKALEGIWLSGSML